MNHAIRHEEPAEYTVTPPQPDIIEQAKAVLLRQLRDRRVAGDTRFTTPTAATDYAQLQLADREHEVFAIFFLDTHHRLLRFEELFRGTIDSAAVYPREVAKRALELNASAVILAHNHPTGLADPSDADRRITTRLKEALGLFDIRVLDHIVVGEDTVSFAERGYL